MSSLALRHTGAAQRHYPGACRVAEQFGHALRMHRSYGAECVRCGAIFAESDAEAMDSAHVGDAEARELAGSFAQDCLGFTAPAAIRRRADRYAQHYDAWGKRRDDVS